MSAQKLELRSAHQWDPPSEQSARRCHRHDFPQCSTQHRQRQRSLWSRGDTGRSDVDSKLDMPESGGKSSSILAMKRSPQCQGRRTGASLSSGSSPSCVLFVSAAAGQQQHHQPAAAAAANTTRGVTTEASPRVCTKGWKEGVWCCDCVRRRRKQQQGREEIRVPGRRQRQL